MKYYGFITLILIGVVLNGCYYSAKVTNFGGKFYNTGDQNCVYYRAISDSQIQCANENKIPTGYRNAMTEQELQMYMHKQNLDQQESAQINYNLQQQSNRNQQMLNNFQYGYKPY